MAKIIAVCVLLTGCAESNNLLLGTVQAKLGSHRVRVTDCYRMEAPLPVARRDGGVTAWEYAPCRDAVISIKGEILKVNGRSYGRLDADDGVLVDHGVVSIGAK